MSKTHIRLLGAFFLFQAVTSLTSGAVLVNPVIDVDSMEMTIRNIMEKSHYLYGAVLLDTFTSIGIIFLGVMMYRSFSGISKTASIAALSLYVCEATILMVSKMLLFISTNYVLAGDVDTGLLSAFINGVDSAYLLHMIPFSIGAFIFYSLSIKSDILPRGISLWGVISIIPFIFGVPLQVLQFNIPFLIYVPYVPFEFAAGLFLLIKSFRLKHQM